MKLLTCILPLLFAVLSAQGQNHVPNPSFEQFSACPPDFSYFTNYCDNWKAFTSATPDYFNDCNSGTVGVPANFIGHQAPADGTAYAGIFTFTDTAAAIWKEYIQTDIIRLQENFSYDVSMLVSLADSSGYASDDLGVFFYDQGSPPMATTALFSVTPQVSFSSYGPLADKSGWAKLEASFVADSAYSKLVIGGFKALANLTKMPVINSTMLYPHGSYYYIDLIEVRPSKVRIAPVDTSLCAGDTMIVPYIVPSPGVYQPGNVFTAQLSDTNGIFATPLDVGSVSATVSGNIIAMLPASLPYSDKYKVRVVASSRADTSTPYPRSIRITPPPQVTASATSYVCTGEPLYLDGAVDIADSIVWSGPFFSSAHIDTVIPNVGIVNAGLYILKAVRHECIAYDTTEVAVKPLPVASINSNAPVCYGDTLLLYGAGGSSGIREYEWQGPGFISQLINPYIPRATTANDGMYLLTVMEDGCRSLPDTLLVDVRPACDGSCFFFPGAFTPNADGLNDLFGYIALCPVLKYELRIYNRWGQQVFYTRDVNAKWDGTYNGVPQDQNTFYYFIRYILDVPGQSTLASTLRGDVILLR